MKFAYMWLLLNHKYLLFLYGSLRRKKIYVSAQISSQHVFTQFVSSFTAHASAASKRGISLKKHNSYFRVYWRVSDSTHTLQTYMHCKVAEKALKSGVNSLEANFVYWESGRRGGLRDGMFSTYIREWVCECVCVCPKTVCIVATGCFC